MKKHVFLYIFIWCCYQFYAQELFADPWHHVRWVDDGDTIVIDDGRHVRYIGMNAPEIEHEGQKLKNG